MIGKLDNLDARIPSWNFSDLVVRDCPICRSGGQESCVRPDNLTVNHCSVCNTWFVSPAPSETQLGDFYAQYGRIHRRTELPDREFARIVKNTNPLTSPIIQEIISLMSLKGKRCLDIGFGRGYYLNFFRSLGAVPEGIELDAAAITYAREYLQVPDVKRATIFEIGDTARYDVITMIDFIEHPLNPAEAFEKAASLLNDRGLMVVWTPNGSFAGEDPESIMFRVDLEHMQYLSFKTCEFLARKTGLDIVHLEGVGFPDLCDMDKISARDTSRLSLGTKVRAAIKALPGFQKADRIRQALRRDIQRTGRYHLFCIFRKPG